MRALRFLVLAFVLLGAHAALAVQPDEMLKDPALEGRARVISQELRCMVCQNQSIDDSDAPLAHDLRLLVRRRLEAGDTNQQVIDFLVSRYGEFVLLRPRFELHTLLLWLAPPGVLVIGGIALFTSARRRKAGGQDAVVPAKLTPEQEARLAQIINGES